MVFATVGRLASVTATAHAEPRLSASGFVGIDWFGEHTEVGNSWAPEQVPGTAPLVGGCVSWLALPGLSANLELAIEGEFAIAPAFTGATISATGNGGRMSYFASVFEWRAHALLRLARWRAIEPHLVLGGGGETVTSTSPFMSKETDPVVRRERLPGPARQGPRRSAPGDLRSASLAKAGGVRMREIFQR